MHLPALPRSDAVAYPGFDDDEFKDHLHIMSSYGMGTRHEAALAVADMYSSTSKVYLEDKIFKLTASMGVDMARFTTDASQSRVHVLLSTTQGPRRAAAGSRRVPL